MSAYRELLDRYVERYNAGDLDAVMELYADDAVQGMPDGIFEGRERDPRASRPGAGSDPGRDPHRGELRRAG